MDLQSAENYAAMKHAVDEAIAKHVPHVAETAGSPHDRFMALNSRFDVLSFVLMTLPTVNSEAVYVSGKTPGGKSVSINLMRVYDPVTEANTRGKYLGITAEIICDDQPLPAETVANNFSKFQDWPEIHRKLGNLEETFDAAEAFVEMTRPGSLARAAAVAR